MNIENKEIILRALENSDIDLLYKWENDRSIWQTSNTITPFSKYILKKYIENSHHDIYQAKQLRLMIDIADLKTVRTVGTIDLFDFDPYHLRAGVGILIGGGEERNKGVATKALRELVEYSFKILQLHQLYCNISADNKASIRLFEKSGFSVCGTKKEWIKTVDGYIDEYTLQLINNFK